MTPVSIVGAGPGDPSLISVRGWRCLARADVVVHDTLIDPRLLRMASGDAERIDVGPAAPADSEQEAICLLVAEKAREGRYVVRLKWGDPFLYDSGGKEALFLHEQGIPFEVVPGIPALVGIPAYAGIPITYPGSGNLLTFIRGYEDGDDNVPSLDWHQLAKVDGTLLCYAGPRQLARVASSLLAHGRPADDSAAVIFNGTTPQQRTQTGTLGDLAHQLAANAPPVPAVLVVGPATGLRNHLRWFDERPLFGTRIVVTRSREQAGEFVERLHDLGAEVIEAPSIQIEALGDYDEVDRVIAGIGAYDWLVFTSVNGVDHFMRRALSRVRDIRDLHGPRLCAVGPATAERLQRLHLRVDVMPEEDHAEGVIAALKATGSLEGVRMLLPRADIARDVLPDELRKAGAEVDDITTYRTVRAPWGQEGQPDIYKKLLEGDVDIVTFTSASSVRHFVTNLGEDQAADLLQHVAVASIGPVTAEAAQQLGVATQVMPQSPYTIPSLVQAIVAYVGSKRLTPDT